MPREILDKVKCCLGLQYDHQFDRYIDSLREERKGVIIGIRRKIFRLRPFSGVEPDLVVTVPRGLSIDYISGLEALGQFELDEILNNDFRNVEILY